MNSPTRPGLAELVYRLLLLAYPASFRRDHAREAAETFAEVHAETRGVAALAGLWTRTVANVLSDGLAERQAARASTQPRARRTGIAGRIVRDAWMGVRLWRRTPMHAAVAVGSLALGVGVNVAVVNLMFTLFVRPPNVTAPDELAVVTAIVDDEVSTGFDADVTMALATRVSSFDGVAAGRFGWAWMAGAGRSVELQGSVVSWNYFDVLGVGADQGRVFHAADEGTTPAHSVGVISHQVWTDHFGADPSAIGSTISVNGTPVRLVGVTPRGFRGLYASAARDIWLPHDLGDRTGEGETFALFRAGGSFEVVGRLADGHNLESAAGDVSSVLAGMLPSARPIQVVLEPVKGAGVDGDAFLGAPLLAVGIAAALLLLTCLNLAGLLLARNLARRRELAVRVALGSTRWRLVLQLTSETLAIVVAAGIAGIAAAGWAQSLIARWYAYSLPGLELSMSAAAVAGAMTVALASAVLFGGLPAWLATRGDVSTGLRNAGSRSATGASSVAERGLLVGQVALSLVLVTGAVAMMQSMAAATLSAGDSPAAVLHYRLRPSRVGYGPDAALGYQRRVLAGVASVPGVRAAAIARVGTDRGWCCPVEVSRPDEADGQVFRLSNNHVTPRFFEALGIPVLSGRGFTEADDATSPRVVVINRALAARLWPGESPLGRRLRIDDVDHEVIGVTPTLHASQPGEDPVGYLYLAYWQAGAVDARLFVRHEGAGADVGRGVAAALDAADPDVHVGQVGTLEERVALAHAPQQALMQLLRASAVIAVLLCALGLYGQMSVAVLTRTREHAIRAALGASPGRLRRAVVGDGLRLVGTGVAIGLAGAWAQGQLLRAYLYGVQPVEPLVLLGATLLLATVGWTTTMLPAARAARTQPNTLLR